MVDQRKRKRQSDAHHALDNHSSQISKASKTTHNSKHIFLVRRNNTKARPIHNLCSIPDEVLFHIVSYIGPLSESLLALSMTTKHHNVIINQIGKSLLKNSQHAFRNPPSPVHPLESNISIFLRYARKGFKANETLLRLSQWVEIMSDGNENNSDSVNDVYESGLFDAAREGVDVCLATATSLLQTSSQHCSRNLEEKILRVCGKCGAKAFKFSKRLVSIATANAAVAVTDDGTTMIRSESVYVDKERMVKAQFLMHCVLVRMMQVHGLSLNAILS